MGAWIWPRALGVGVPRRALDGLGRGLHDADLSTLYGIRRVVHTLRQDLAAVANFSEGNVNACAAAGIEPVIAMGREAHHPSLAERFAEDPTPPKDPTPVASMRHRLQTKEGNEALRPAQADP